MPNPHPSKPTTSPEVDQFLDFVARMIAERHLGMHGRNDLAVKQATTKPRRQRGANQEQQD